MHRRQGSRPSSRKSKVKKAKWFSEETLQIAEKRRYANGKGEKERYKHLNAKFQRIARRDKKAFHVQKKTCKPLPLLGLRFLCLES